MSESPFPLCIFGGRERLHVSDRFCKHTSISGGAGVATLESCLACRLRVAEGVLPEPKPGVGDILARMIREKWGTDFIDACGCAGYVATMNAWGPEGCRRERATIVQWLCDGVQKLLAADTLGKYRWVQRTPEKLRRWYLGRLVDAAIAAAERAIESGA